MDIRVAGSAGEQITPHKVNRRDSECEIRSGSGLSGVDPIPAGSIPARSSYRKMGLKGPAFASHTLPVKRPVQAFAEAGKRFALDPHPVYPGRAAPWKGARPAQPDFERSRLLERLRRGDERRQKLRGNVSHETQRDVQAFRRHPAYGGKGLAHVSQRAPQPLTNLVRRPDREEQAQGSQPTGTATGRSVASTPWTAASTSLCDEAHPSEKRTAPSSDVPRILWTSGAQ